MEHRHMSTGADRNVRRSVCGSTMLRLPKSGVHACIGRSCSLRGPHDHGRPPEVIDNVARGHRGLGCASTYTTLVSDGLSPSDKRAVRRNDGRARQGRASPRCIWSSLNPRGCVEAAGRGLRACFGSSLAGSEGPVRWREESLARAVNTKVVWCENTITVGSCGCHRALMMHCDRPCRVGTRRARLRAIQGHPVTGRYSPR